MSASAARLLAEYAAEVTYDALPASVISKAKACILDTLGCILEGARREEPFLLFNALSLLSPGSHPIWGTTRTTSISGNCLLHGAMAHVTEYDDAHKTSKMHPGSVVFPAAVGAGIVSPQGSGKDLLAALVTGYEVALRIGIAANARAHRLQGWHATSTCGIFGSTIAAGKMLGLTADQLTSALGSAGTQAAGIWAFAADGAMSKSLHAGKAAANGLLSAMLARNHFTGSEYILDAVDGGFFATYTAQSPENWRPLLLDNLGLRYEIEEVAFKPYPCCRMTHTAIDATLELLREHPIAWNQVRHITVTTFDVAVQQCGFSDPVNPRQAQFSLPFVIATTLCRKRPPTTADFAMFEAPDVIDLHHRIQVKEDPELSALFPGSWPVVIEVEGSHGHYRRQRVDVALGDPLRPLTIDDSVRKFKECANNAIASAQVDALINFVMELDQVEDSVIPRLNRLLQASSPSLH